MDPSTLRWTVATVVTGGLIGLVLAAHQVILVAFLGLLLGVLLDSLAEILHPFAGWSQRFCARMLLLTLLLLGLGAAIQLGPTAVAGTEELMARAPQLLEIALDRLRGDPLGALVLDSLPDPQDLLAGLGIETLTTTALGLGRGLAGLGMVLFVGAAIGLDPGRHGRWALNLVPAAARPRAHEIGAATHRALQYWLVGRLVDMAALMVLTWIGLWILGIPFAPGLAVLAGLLEFIPYLGPVLSVFPALFVAFASPRPEAILHVLTLYAFLQVLQSYVITPLIEQRAVRVPPALGLTSQAAMALLAGPIGVLVATPLVVVLIVLIQTLYLQDRMKEAVRVLGAESAGPPADPAPG